MLTVLEALHLIQLPEARNVMPAGSIDRGLRELVSTARGGDVVPPVFGGRWDGGEEGDVGGSRNKHGGQN